MALVKFYRGASHANWAKNDGTVSIAYDANGIYFDTTTRTLWLGDNLYCGGALKDVAQTANATTLTLTFLDGTSKTIQLDSAHVLTSADIKDGSGNVKIAKDSTITAALDALQDEIDTLTGGSYVTTFGEKTGDITLKAASEIAGDINLTMSNNELQASIVGLEDVATTGAATDVSVADKDNVIAADNVEEALIEIAKDVDALESGAVGSLSTAAAAASNVVTYTTTVTAKDGTTALTSDDFKVAAGATNSVQYLTATASGDQGTIAVNGDQLQAATDTTYTNSKLALASYVDEQIADTVSKAVIYKGTTAAIATTVYSSTNTSGVENGWMYKVSADIKDGDTVVAKTGDTIIYTVDGTTVTPTVIPSGDDIEYTGVKVGDTTVISATNGGDVTFAAGDDLEVSASGTTITYKHKTPADGTPITPGDGTADGSALSAISVDSYGHVTAASKVSVVNSIDEATGEKYITVDTTSGAATISSVTKTIAAATSTSDGLATAYDVQDYLSWHEA